MIEVLRIVRGLWSRLNVGLATHFFKKKILLVFFFQKQIIFYLTFSIFISQKQTLKFAH
jgi:hypothetical protein